MIKICKCGCNQEFIVNKRWKYRANAQEFISGHNLKLLGRTQHKKHIYSKEELEKKVALGKKLFAEGKTGFNWQRGKCSPMKGKKHSEATKDKLRKCNLGKKHSDYTKNKCREIAFKLGYGKWMTGKKQSKETRKKQADKLRGIMPKNLNMDKIKFGGKRFGNIKRGYYNINGKKLFFRSAWEANYALYLDFLINNKKIQSWEYEADVFIFDKIKFGTRSFRPDFKLLNNDNSIEYHEIKGYMDSQSKTKLNRMKMYYPGIKIRVVGSREYNQLKRQLSFVMCATQNMGQAIEDLKGLWKRGSIAT